MRGETRRGVDSGPNLTAINVDQCALHHACSSHDYDSQLVRVQEFPSRRDDKTLIDIRGTISAELTTRGSV